jgi:hypothetical protein
MFNRIVNPFRNLTERDEKVIFNNPRIKPEMNKDQGGPGTLKFHLCSSVVSIPFVSEQIVICL